MLHCALLLVLAVALSVTAMPDHCPLKFIRVDGTYGRLNNNVYAFKFADSAFVTC